MNPAFAGQYAALETWHWWFEGRRRILEAILHRELPTGVARRIVSVGAGPLAGVAWLERFAGRAGLVVGVDAQPVHAGRPISRRAGLVGRAEALPLAPGSCQVVLALDVLEHLDDDAAGLREVVRVVEPGGLLVITVPALPALWGAQDVVSHHRRRYTRATLLALFDRAHVPRPRVTYFNTLLFPMVALVRGLGRLRAVPTRPRSDFEYSRPGVTNTLLATVFGAERHLLTRIGLPIGVSLLATARPVG